MKSYELKLASYLLGNCFLRTDYKCGNAKLQKLVIIANLRNLYERGSVLFDESILVNLCGFGLKTVAGFFPPYICGEKEREKDDCSRNLILPNEISPNTVALNPLFDAGMSEVDEETGKLLENVFYRFGAYNPKRIGEIMNNMQLHRTCTMSEINEFELKAYMHNGLWDDIDKQNEIALFIENGN